MSQQTEHSRVKKTIKQVHYIDTQRQTLALINMKFRNPSNCQPMYRKRYTYICFSYKYFFLNSHFRFFTGSFQFS